MQTRSGGGGGYRTKESQRRRRRIVKLISSSSGSNGKRRIVKCLGRNVFESRDDDDDDDVPTTSINTGHYTRLLQLSLIPRLFENGASQPANNSRPDTRRAAMLPSTFFFFFFPSICSREFTSDVSLLKGTLVNLITGQAFVRRNDRLCIPFSLRI